MTSNDTSNDHLSKSLVDFSGLHWTLLEKEKGFQNNKARDALRNLEEGTPNHPQHSSWRRDTAKFAREVSGLC